MFRLFCVTSLKVSEPNPLLFVPAGFLGAVTTVTRAISSAEPCRSLGILCNLVVH